VCVCVGEWHSVFGIAHTFALEGDVDVVAKPSTLPDFGAGACSRVESVPSTPPITPPTTLPVLAKKKLTEITRMRIPVPMKRDIQHTLRVVEALLRAVAMVDLSSSQQTTQRRKQSEKSEGEESE
jgi:hypothetical protein